MQLHAKQDPGFSLSQTRSTLNLQGVTLALDPQHKLSAHSVGELHHCSELHRPARDGCKIPHTNHCDGTMLQQLNPSVHNIGLNTHTLHTPTRNQLELPALPFPTGKPQCSPPAGCSWLADTDSPRTPTAEARIPVARKCTQPRCWQSTARKKGISIEGARMAICCSGQPRRQKTGRWSGRPGLCAHRVHF